MKILILIILAASFIGFWQKREVYKPAHQSAIASLYFLAAVFVVFGQSMIKGVTP